MDKYIQFLDLEPKQHILHAVVIYQDKRLVLIEVSILEYISFENVWGQGWSKSIQNYEFF